MSIALIPKKFISRAVDFKNEGTKNKWVVDLLTELESTIDAVNLVIPAANTPSQAPGDYIAALTGDVTATGPGSVVATLANIAANSMLGNNTGSPAHQLALTAAQVKTLLAIVEGDISLSDITTDNVSISKHGFAPKAPNDVTKFLRGDASYAAPVSYALVSGSDATTTGQTLVDVTDLSLSLLANAMYEFEAKCNVNSSTTAGTKYAVGLTNPTGATLEAKWSGNMFSVNTINRERIMAFNTATAAFSGTAGDGMLLIEGILITGANPGNLTIQHLKVTSGTSTVYINSFLKVRRIA